MPTIRKAPTKSSGPSTLRESPAPPPSPQTLRADARRNRERLLAAASEAFAEHGATASMDDVAKRAKVGIGTLYRHFPTRESLLAATVEDGLLVFADRDWSRPSGSSADALGRFLEALAAHASTYRGLAASLGVVLASGTPGCHAASATGERLLKSAQAEGSVDRHADFGDVVCMATAIALATQQTPSDPERAKRLVRMFVDGLRARAKVSSSPASKKQRERRRH
ncbi:MAG: TetR/AcrR family transcriptional regulator [Polyangiaceae bacterium]|nr:TetR/AcrR family transcriptional regulator [Polyangiaceae bacterium]